MRKILFRGKTTDNKKWIYGNFFEGIDGKCYISVGYDNKRLDTEVIPESVGEFVTYIGSSKLFEGDIVEFRYGGSRYQVRWNIDACRYELFTKTYLIPDGDDKLEFGDYRVIGNMFDNEELLEE